MSTQLKFTLLALLILVTAGVGAMHVLWVRVETAAIARENQRLEFALAQLEIESRDLTRQVAQLERPERLNALLVSAGSRLRPMEPAQTLYHGSQNASLAVGSVSMASSAPSPFREPPVSAPASPASRAPIFLRE